MQQTYLTYYQLLSVETNATTEQILAAYREKAKKYHPDKNSGSEISNEMFRYLAQAKEWLSDPTKRQQYDRLIGITPTPASDPKIIYRDRMLAPNAGSNNDTVGIAVAAGLIGLLVGVLFFQD
jgi:curved DNA-binding protein CbpA